MFGNALKRLLEGTPRPSPAPATAAASPLPAGPSPNAALQQYFGQVGETTVPTYPGRCAALIAASPEELLATQEEVIVRIRDNCALNEAQFQALVYPVLLRYAAYVHLLPASENQYRKAIGHVDAYLVRLTDDDEFNAQFYARADNLADWLAVVEKRLGSLSQRLSASVGQIRVDTDLGGDKDARQSTPAPDVQTVRTPWLKVDDVFYEARGSTWALLHFLRAVEHDFEPVLRDKNALVSLRQIIRELEESQTPLFSPIVLNGSPYGFFANHSLVMANYISRANAAVIDLRKLLERG